MEALGIRRRLEAYSPPPRSKSFIKKLRAAVLDGILTTLRAIKEVSVTSMIGHGEGAVIAMAVLSEDLRKEAYAMRRVPDGERVALEDIARALSHVVLLAPHVLPAKSYRPLLHESVPEIVSIFAEEDTQVLAVIPTKEPLTIHSRNLAQGVFGATEEQVKFLSPAHRHLPLLTIHGGYPGISSSVRGCTTSFRGLYWPLLASHHRCTR